MFRLDALDDRTKTFRDALTCGFRLGSAIDERPQVCLRLRQSFQLGKFLYSKIHCLAAALNFARSASLPASE